MVDMTSQRHLLQLGKTECTDYPAGESEMHFSAPSIDVETLNKSWLNNVGLLLVWDPVYSEATLITKASVTLL